MQSIHCILRQAVPLDYYVVTLLGSEAGVSSMLRTLAAA